MSWPETFPGLRYLRNCQTTAQANLQQYRGNWPPYFPGWPRELHYPPAAAESAHQRIIVTRHKRNTRTSIGSSSRKSAKPPAGRGQEREDELLCPRLLGCQVAPSLDLELGVLVSRQPTSPLWLRSRVIATAPLEDRHDRRPRGLEILHVLGREEPLVGRPATTPRSRTSQ